MTISTPILANEHNSAKLLDMKPVEFRGLVREGHLPQPRVIAGYERWDVEELRQVGRGDAAQGGRIEW